MSLMPVTERITAAEFIAMPVPERGRPWNLVDGEVVVNQPTDSHARVHGDLQFALESWCRAAPGRGLVSVARDVYVDEGNVFAPDILWYADDRIPERGSAAPYPMPNLAIEVRSPSTWRFDLGAKKSGYERGGLPELWLADTAAWEILVFRRSKRGAHDFDVALELDRTATLTSPLLPGFALDLSQVFPAG